MDCTSARDDWDSGICLWEQHGVFPNIAFLTSKYKSTCCEQKLPWSNGRLLILAGITSIQEKIFLILLWILFFLRFFHNLLACFQLGLRLRFHIMLIVILYLLWAMDYCAEGFIHIRIQSSQSLTVDRDGVLFLPTITPIIIIPIYSWGNEA